MKMDAYKIQLAAYTDYLVQQERSAATVAQYRRDVLRFLTWSEGMDAVKETVIRYKQYLQTEYQTASINVKLAALNGFFAFLERFDLRVKQLKIQQQAYCAQEKELSKKEYRRLVEAAFRQGNEKLALVLQTICATGIRISELQFITVEAVRQGDAAIRLKGKNRMVLLTDKLCRLLRDYIRKEKLTSGSVFVTRNGTPLDRSNVWKAMKALCSSAGVDAKKVFPHNLRHLFARCFYTVYKDIAKLADILGHSSINTTRLYIISTGAEHRRQMAALGLVE